MNREISSKKPKSGSMIGSIGKLTDGEIDMNVTDLPVGKYVLYCSDFAAAGIGHECCDGGWGNGSYGEHVIGPGRVLTLVGCRRIPGDLDSILVAIQHKRETNRYVRPTGFKQDDN